MQQCTESVLVEDEHAEFDSLVVLRSGEIVGDDVGGVFDAEAAALPPRAAIAPWPRRGRSRSANR
jgi:hypothetical protein